MAVPSPGPKNFVRDRTVRSPVRQKWPRTGPDRTSPTLDHQRPVSRAPADPKNNGEPRGEVTYDVAMPAADLWEAAQESLNLNNFQRLVLMTETVNKLQRQMNASRQARQADPTHTSTVLDNEEEELVPIDMSLMSGLPAPASLLTALPVLGSLGADNTGIANANMNLSGLTEDAAANLEPIRWMKVMMNTMINPNTGRVLNKQGNDECTPDEALAVTHTNESAQKNTLELDMDSLPMTLLLMACARIYVPLSLLTTAASD